MLSSASVEGEWSGVSVDEIVAARAPKSKGISSRQQRYYLEGATVGHIQRQSSDSRQAGPGPEAHGVRFTIPWLGISTTGDSRALFPQQDHGLDSLARILAHPARVTAKRDVTQNGAISACPRLAPRRVYTALVAFGSKSTQCGIQQSVFLIAISAPH